MCTLYYTQLLFTVAPQPQRELEWVPAARDELFVVAAEADL